MGTNNTLAAAIAALSEEQKATFAAILGTLAADTPVVGPVEVEAPKFKRIPREEFKALKKAGVVPWGMTQEKAFIEGLLPVADAPAKKATPAKPAAKKTAAKKTAAKKGQKVCAEDGCTTKFAPSNGRQKFCPTHSKARTEAFLAKREAWKAAHPEWTK